MVLVAVLVVGPDVDQLGNKKTFCYNLPKKYHEGTRQRRSINVYVVIK